MRKYFFLHYIALLIITFSSLSSPQNIDQEKINSEFSNAVRLYDNNKLNSALTAFEKIILNYPYNTKTTASHFFKIKILVDLNEYDKAENEINSFVERFPNSKYIDEVRVLRVKLYIDTHKYYEALRELANIIDKSKYVSYKIQAKSLGEKLARNYLTSSEIKPLSDTFTGENVRPYLLLLYAKKLQTEGKKLVAERALNEILNNYPNSVEYTEAKNLLEQPFTPNDNIGDQILIAVLLPLNIDLTGPTNKAASEILEGIKFAVSEFNKNRTEKIGIVVRDTRNSEERINEIEEEVGNNYNFKAIIGPIYSDEARFAIQAFDGTGIPIISPTATDEDLTQLSEDFFQANPPIGVRGKIMAQYLYFVENKRFMGVVNSIDGYSPLLANNFMSEFERLGGHIVGKETYKSNELMVRNPFTNFLSADTLDGIYAPLSEKSDAPALLSLMVQDSLYVPLYGNQDWFFAKGFETSPELSNMLTFSSDFFIEFENPSFKEFSAKFLEVTGTDVNRNILYGYDTAKYLLTVMRNVTPLRQNIKDKMLSGVISQGFHNNISFDSNRTNRFLNIVRYKDGVFELIDKFRSTN